MARGRFLRAAYRTERAVKRGYRSYRRAKRSVNATRRRNARRIRKVKGFFSWW
jgi:hypothetical protein